MKKIIGYLSKSKLLTIPRRWIGKLIAYSVSAKQGVIIFYNSPRTELEKSFSLIRKVRKNCKMKLKDLEVHQIYLGIKKTEKIKGEIAEVGVYQGGTAKIVSEITDKPLHLFDTFNGLPELSKFDDLNQFHKGDYRETFENVKKLFKNRTNVYFYKGLFPDTANNIKNKKFSFVHLDVDLYQSTVDCLNFFYPRMNKGGMIISHDYAERGCKKAIDDFLADKAEIAVEIPGSDCQCLIIKT